MAVAIADSSAIVALLKPDDSCHRQAVAAARSLIQQGVDVVLPSEVLAETLNILGKKVSNAAAVDAAHKLLSAQFIVTSSAPDMLSAAADKLSTHKQSTSYVDALVMTWADHYQTRTVLGFDAVFAKSGYGMAVDPIAGEAA